MHVFISHAGEDKGDERFRAIVHRLFDVLYADERMPADLRIGLWIDRPQEVSNDARLLECGRIPAGKTWSEEIEKAIAHEDVCILFFLSRNAFRKLKGIDAPPTAGLEWELQRGQSARRLVAVKLDDTDPEALPERYRAIQFLDLSDYSHANEPHHFRYLVDDIKERVGLQRANVAERLAAFVQRGVQTANKSPDPYRANRVEQANVFQGALDQTQSASGSIRPLIFAGPDDEAPEQFLERCFRESRRVLGEEPCDRHVVTWPSSGDFGAAYQQALSTHFNGHPSASRERVVQSLRALRRPTVFYSFVFASTWSEGEPARIAAWIREWRRLNIEAGGGLRVVPLLCLKFARSGERRWRGCPPTPAGQLFDNVTIWSSVRAVCAKLAESEPPPLLAPLQRADADTWLAIIRDEVRHDTGGVVEKLDRAIGDMFRARPRYWFSAQNDPPFVTMRRFASTVNGLQNDERGPATP